MKGGEGKKQKQTKKSAIKSAPITSLLVGGRANPRQEIPIIFEPVFLSKEDNDTRIKRLSLKILDAVEHAKRERGGLE